MNKSNMKARDAIGKGGGIIDHYIFTHIAYFILHTCNIRIRPELIALGNFSFVLCFFFILWFGEFQLVLVCAVLYVSYPLRDILDGAMARYHNMTNQYGIYLDSLIDVLSETLVLFGLCLHFGLEPIFFLIALLPLVTSYTLLQEKVLLHKKEKQLNVLDYLPLQIHKPLSLVRSLGVIFTRNDMRKLIILLCLGLQTREILFIYFIILYSVASIISIRNIVLGSKPFS